MLIDYIYYKLSQAKYKILEDGSYFAEIPDLQGVWGSGKSLEACREDLREVLEEWLILKLKDGDRIPNFPSTPRSGVQLLPVLKHA